jgi:hypothetical protein
MLDAIALLAGWPLALLTTGAVRAWRRRVYATC